MPSMECEINKIYINLQCTIGLLSKYHMFMYHRIDHLRIKLMINVKALYNYTNIDLKLWNISNGPMHYNSRYMCIQLTSVLNSVIIPQQFNPPISKSSRTCNEFTCV